MNLRAEAEFLRCRLKQLAEEHDTGFNRRYAMQFWTPEKPSLIRRLRMNTGRLFRWLGIMRPAPAPPPPPPDELWLAELKHVDYGNGARPLLVWAVDIDRDKLRNACLELKKLLSGSPGWAPVLVTDVADFAFYSRLNWLVEYVPSLSTPENGYAERKLRHLAWRYRGAVALPVTARTTEAKRLEDLLVD